MILCPVCGSAKSLRLSDGQRECSMCYHVYEVPKPAPKRRRRSTATTGSAITEQPVAEQTEQSEEE